VRVTVTFLNERKFVQCCFVSVAGVIGDFEQHMLLGNFELAVSDLIERLRNLPAHDFKSSGDIGDVYVGMSEAFLNGNFEFFEKIPGYIQVNSLESSRFAATPLAVEAFDGEEAYQFKFEDRWQLVWREWSTKKIKSIPLDREEFIGILESALIESKF
jgi:hypothetical protein